MPAADAAGLRFHIAAFRGADGTAVAAMLTAHATRLRAGVATWLGANRLGWPTVFDTETASLSIGGAPGGCARAARTVLVAEAGDVSSKRVAAFSGAHTKRTLCGRLNPWRLWGSPGGWFPLLTCDGIGEGQPMVRSTGAGIGGP
jgi:hypothetical protein